MLTSTKRRKGKNERMSAFMEWIRPSSVHHSAHFYNELLIEMLRDHFFPLQKGILYINFCSST